MLVATLTNSEQNRQQHLQSRTDDDKIAMLHSVVLALQRIGGDGQAIRQATKDLEMVAALNPGVVLENAKNFVVTRKNATIAEKLVGFARFLVLTHSYAQNYGQ
jgi:hypothetical protein